MFGTPERDEEASDPGDLEEDCGEDPEEEAIEPEGEEPAEENFDPVESADKLPPAGVAEICSSPEVAAEVAAAPETDVKSATWVVARRTWWLPPWPCRQSLAKVSQL